MKRFALILALTSSLAAAQVGGNLPDAASPPDSATVTVAPAPTVTVQSTVAARWWESGALMTAIVTVGGTALTGFFSYRLGLKKQVDNAALQRDNLDNESIKQRENTIEKMLGLLTSQLDHQSTIVAENAANKARLDDVLSREAAREERERELFDKVARLQETVNHISDCKGGQPCPFTGLKSLGAQ